MFILCFSQKILFYYGLDFMHVSVLLLIFFVIIMTYKIDFVCNITNGTLKHFACVKYTKGDVSQQLLYQM